MSDITIVNMNVRRQTSKELPTGALTLVSVFENEGIEVDFKDYAEKKRNLDLFNIKNTYNYLRNTKRFLLISYLANMRPNLLLALEKLKETNPEKKIILGGYIQEKTAIHMIEQFPFIDVIYLGYADKTICEVYKRLKDGQSLRGIGSIVFSENNRIIISKKINRTDINIPKPAYHKIKIKDYDTVCISDSVGCPYKCTFCATPTTMGSKIYYSPISQLRKEITTLYDKGVKKINFIGESFGINKKKVNEICNFFNEEKMDLKWSCYGRINYMTKEILQKISKAGCYNIFYGVESGSNKVLRTIKKGFNTTEAMEKIIETKKYIEGVRLNLMWGYPFETMKDFMKTILLSAKLNAMGMDTGLWLLSPVTDTPIYEKYNHRMRFSPDKICIRYDYKEIKKDEKLRKIISNHPEIFTDFYHYHSKNIDKKAAMIKITSGGKKYEI
ncbi:B12-binding domain-containing radical SAM protein [Candidatus Woesearchaeota archaeon]|nr:B12-binding domain-containing radical SAM protein [Candidatus Woesearchaeota archaeon]